MAQNSRLPVLVVGAGPTGLVLALTLLKNGVPTRIIQKDGQYHIGQRGAGVQPRTLEMYNFLGVLPEILAEGIPLAPVRLYKAYDGGEPIRTFNLVPTLDASPSAPWTVVWGIGQAHAEKILRAHLAKYGCHVELSTELRDFEQHDDYVAAKIVRRMNGQEVEETVECDWLVGADGGRGIVRKLLGLTFLGEALTAQMIFGETHIQGLSQDTWHMWGDVSEKLVILRPTEYDEVINYIIMGPAVDYEKIYSDDAELIDFIRTLTGNKDLVFGDVAWKSDYRPSARMVNKLGEGRVFVAGDAAHVHSPTGAQGMNSSVQDSFNLGWKLALVYKSLASRSLLTTYNEERLPVIKNMLERTTNLFNTTFSESRPSSGPRAYGEGWANTQELKMLGVNYRWSSIVVDERTSRGSALDSSTALDAYAGGESSLVCAGDRAPDAPGLVYSNPKGTQSTSIFQIVGVNYHTAFIFSPDPAQRTDVEDELKRYSEDAIRTVIIHPKGMPVLPVKDSILALVDSENHAYQGYGAVPGELTVAIIRPDGVIGAIVFGRPGLQKYLRGILSSIWLSS